MKRVVQKGGHTTPEGNAQRHGSEKRGNKSLHLAISFEILTWPVDLRSYNNLESV